MNHTTANCGHPTVAVGAPASLARRHCEANLCYPCSREPWPPVLFLDVDGVMNDHRWDPEVASGVILAEHVARLNRVLRETGAKIVLSSAWRYIVLRGEAALFGMEWLFRSHGILANRLLGITGPDTLERCVYRGEPGTWPRTNAGMLPEPIRDLLAPLVTRYAVVDDIDLGISESGHPFVQTDGKIGMTDHANRSRPTSRYKCGSRSVTSTRSTHATGLRAMAGPWASQVASGQRTVWMKPRENKPSPNPSLIGP